MISYVKVSMRLNGGFRNILARVDLDRVARNSIEENLVRDCMRMGGRDISVIWLNEREGRAEEFNGILEEWPLIQEWVESGEGDYFTLGYAN